MHSVPPIPEPVILTSLKHGPALGGEASSSCPARKITRKALPTAIPSWRTGVRAALTGGSPAWSGTSGPERQIQTSVCKRPESHGRPATCSRTPLPCAGPHASSARTSAPRTWYSASSSLDRRLPEPPIAAVRAQLGQLSPGRRQLSHFRPRGRVPAQSPQQPLLGLRPRARPCLQCPGTLSAAQRASPGSPRAQESWREGPGRSRTRRGGAQAL